MKIYTHATYLIISLMCINATAMEKQAITYYKATEYSNVKSILNIINNHAIHDDTKMVILPKNFRDTAIMKDILAEKLYCAKEGSDIVAFRKLFIINDIDKFNDITHNEIRCHGGQRSLVDAHIIDPVTNKIERASDPISSFTNANSIVIYCGGAYTLPTHRDKGINSQLTNYAFETIKEDTINAINKNNLQQIIVLYGLTKVNSGENGGHDRSPSMLKSFTQFVKDIALECNYNTTTPLHHNRYEAFMPTFDPNATECKPLPDDQAIPGYGNVLIFPLLNK